MIKTPSSKCLHSLLYFSAFVVSAGDTVAREAALLNTPSIYIGGRYLEVHDELEKLGLLYCPPPKETLKLIDHLIDSRIGIHKTFEEMSDLHRRWDNTTDVIIANLGVISHFGNGTVTINQKVMIRTPPGYSLWVTGPVNEFKDGVQPMSGVIETDWIPFPFTMNWKFTRPNVTIRFEKDEPYCFFFPIRRDLVESCDPIYKRLAPRCPRWCATVMAPPRSRPSPNDRTGKLRSSR